MTDWQRYSALILFFILSIGVFLRTYLYPSIPPGINQDEAAAAYEAYSILHTGKDQWGNVFPVHFPGWGAGQSVLYGYLTIPAIMLFDLTVWSSRSTGLILGILTLPILYLTVKRSFDRETALLAVLLTAVLPWHVMISRWGLDANILPFFLLLGCYTVQLALSENAPKSLIVIAFTPTLSPA